MTHTHHTAPTRFVEAGGIRFAFRRFGTPGAAPPLVLNMHFLGTMDHWDPSVTDGLARTREVILFNNAGISSSNGEVPRKIEAMAANAIRFIRALDLELVDVLGLSLGGTIAQEIAVQAPTLVRRLILIGTGPRSGEGMGSLTPEFQAIFGAEYAHPDLLWKAIFFTGSEKSRAAGDAFLRRFRRRIEERDPEVSDAVAPAQVEALGRWGAPAERPWDYLRAIEHRTLVVNGDRDPVIYTANSRILAENLPNADLILYSDASHGAPYQYPDLFVAQAAAFLDT
ncbi:MAG: alpha/beta hydrolase [Gluconacetobacter diazotrophicus]|nr:alpha/beta hydrolase [Gluconacetobacter diazotrophicus]